MFSAEDIQARLRIKPFQPFRILASEGQRFDIYHPDLVFVGRRFLEIGFPDAANPTIFDKLTRLALVHVVALEELPAQTPPVIGQ
ncbi:hypothetical protein AYO44_17195 [Planctomycetaceae bacterium SCGC AG-212-F19]|nr:hypothetical protein AYO44_17195 [Planctomycetaceae bacterium SCGC AG-212-F19]